MINIGVIGGYTCSKKNAKTAFKLGRLIARKGWVLVCGGGRGVMEACCCAAYKEGGLTVGILPGTKTQWANPYVKVAIPTGLGYARNVLVVRASDFLVAIDGKYGTLSEISFALNEGKPVFGINTWKIKGVIESKSPEEVMEKIARKIKAKR